MKTYHTLDTYMNHACLFHAKSGSEVAASPGDSLFAKALSCTISVVKADCAQDRAAIYKLCT